MEKRIDDYFIKQADVKGIRIMFPEGLEPILNLVISLQEIFGKICYVRTDVIYQVDIGQLRVPFMYSGRLLVKEEPSGIWLEADWREFTLENNRFFMNLFGMSDTFSYYWELDSQTLQHYLFNTEEKEIYELFGDKIKGMVQIDNDFTFMDIWYKQKDENKIREFYREFSYEVKDLAKSEKIKAVFSS